MFSYFFSGRSDREIKKSPFESSVELKTLIPIINEMRDKAKSLKTETDKEGRGSVAYQKYSIFLALLDEINNSIEAYNMNFSEKNLLEVKTSAIDFTDGLLLKLQNIFKQHEATLGIQRSDIKANTRGALEMAGLGSFFAGWAAFSLMGGAGLLVGVTALSDSFRNSSYLGRTTASTSLIDHLICELAAISKNLKEDLKINSDRMLNKQTKHDKKMAGYALTHRDSVHSQLPPELKLHILSFFTTDFQPDVKSRDVDIYNNYILKEAERLYLQ